MNTALKPAGVLVLSDGELILRLTPVHNQLPPCMCTQVCEGSKVLLCNVYIRVLIARAAMSVNGPTKRGTDAHMD